MKYFFLFISLLFVPRQGFTQKSFTHSDDFNYKAVYELTYQPDSTDAVSVTSEEMWLYIGDEVSQFSSKGTALKDSFANSENNSTVSMSNFEKRAKMTETEFDYIIYKDIPEDKISYTLKIVTDLLRYEEDKDLFAWEILPETKTIQGFKSQKAKTLFRGREYTAWFTSEIPISDGPYKFHGLPGLILQIQDSKEDYIFKLIELEYLNKPIPVKLDLEAYTLTSREKLLQVKREFEEDPLTGIEKRDPAVGIKVVSTSRKQYLRKLQEELEKKNNPIELE